MHESIAKAKIKGTFRESNTALDIFNNKSMAGNLIHDSKKGIIAYIKKIKDVYGSLLLSEETSSRSSSWHFKSTIIAISPDKEYFENIGEVYPIVVETFNSKFFIKRKEGAHQYFDSTCYVHQHFLQRFLQRTPEERKGKVSNLISSIVFWLSQNCDQSKLIDQASFHFVTKFEVVIVTFSYHQDLYVFNTILRIDKFSPEQKTFNNSSLMYLETSDSDFSIRRVDNTDITVCDLLTHKMLQRVSNNLLFFKRAF